MADLNPQPLPPVRVHITTEIANDLDKMQRVTAEVLGKLGCPGCHSGRVLDFVSLDEFVVDPVTLEVGSAAVGTR